MYLKGSIWNETTTTAQEDAIVLIHFLNLKSIHSFDLIHFLWMFYFYHSNHFFIERWNLWKTNENNKLLWNTCGNDLMKNILKFTQTKKINFDQVNKKCFLIDGVWCCWSAHKTHKHFAQSLIWKPDQHIEILCAIRKFEGSMKYAAVWIGQVQLVAKNKRFQCGLAGEPWLRLHFSEILTWGELTWTQMMEPSTLTDYNRLIWDVFRSPFSQIRSCYISAQNGVNMPGQLHLLIWFHYDIRFWMESDL